MIEITQGDRRYTFKQIYIFLNNKLTCYNVLYMKKLNLEV